MLHKTKLSDILSKNMGLWDVLSLNDHCKNTTNNIQTKPLHASDRHFIRLHLIHSYINPLGKFSI